MEIRKEKVDPSRIALQQARAIIIGSVVIYVTYDPLIDQETNYLTGEFN